MATTPRLMLTPRSAGDPEPDLTSMVVIHRALCQDLARLAALLGETGGHDRRSRQTPAICRYTAVLLAEIRAHQENEEDIIWPVIAATARQSVDLTPLTDDHQAIEVAVDRALEALASAGADPRALADLRVPVSKLSEMVHEHIADEEAQLLPSLRHYLHAETYRWCEKQIQRKAPRLGLPFTAPWLVRYAQPQELSGLLAALGWPTRLLLPASSRGYARLERQAFGAGLS